MSEPFPQAMAELRSRVAGAAQLCGTEPQPIAFPFTPSTWRAYQPDAASQTTLIVDFGGLVLAVARNCAVDLMRRAPEMHQVCTALANYGPEMMRELMARDVEPPLGLALAIDAAAKIAREVRR